MSIEAQALTKLLTSMDVTLSTVGDPKEFEKQMRRALMHAKYWVQPMQYFRDYAHAFWEQRPDWTRPQFLDFAGDGDIHPHVAWVVRCLCLGDMNYRVENVGFYGWLQGEGQALPLDFNVLARLGRYLKTPVGGRFTGIILEIDFLLKNYRLDGRGILHDELVSSLEILTDEYMGLRYDLMVQVEQRIRQDVPVFGASPF